MNENSKRKIKIFLMNCLMLIIIFSSIAACGEHHEWNCPSCGRQGNKGNYCGGCSYPAPWIGLNSENEHQIENSTNEETKEPEAHGPWPVKEIEEVVVSLKALGNDDMRHQAYYGPNKQYAQAGAYKPKKVNSAKAMFQEEDYVLVDLDYQTAGRRCVYFKSSVLTNTDVEPVELKAYSAKTTMTINPKTGPGFEYENITQIKKSPYAGWDVESLVGQFGGSVEIWQALQPSTNTVFVEKGTEIMVFFETNDWIFAEIRSDIGLLRAWLPAEYVE